MLNFFNNLLNIQYIRNKNNFRLLKWIILNNANLQITNKNNKSTKSLLEL